MNAASRILKGSRLLKETEVPHVGDFCRWSESKRDEWREIPKGDTIRSGLPVATIRTRCGQAAMQFCTFRELVTILACSNIEAMMHGVSHFAFNGTQCTAHYTDGQKETAEIPAALIAAMKAYVAYQAGSPIACDAPNAFALVSAIQSQRQPA